MKDDGGPAFPGTVRRTRQGGVDGVIDEWTEHLPGMTLREWYAGQALAGILSVEAIWAAYGKRDSVTPAAKMSTLAYEFADAMLAERSRNPNGEAA